MLDSDFSPQTHKDLHWKPFYFLYKRSVRLRARNRRALASSITDWDSLEQYIAQVAELHAPALDGFESMRSKTSMVLNRIAPITAAIAFAPGITRAEACLLAASVHYCMMRHWEHALGRDRTWYEWFLENVGFAINSLFLEKSKRKARTDQRSKHVYFDEKAKEEYIRGVQELVLSTQDKSEAVRELVGSKFSRYWKYTFGMHASEDSEKVRKFRNSCNDDFARAKERILN